jgi:hypothetical protein
MVGSHVRALSLILHPPSEGLQVNTVKNRNEGTTGKETANAVARAARAIAL